MYKYGIREIFLWVFDISVQFEILAVFYETFFVVVVRCKLRLEYKLFLLE